MVKAFYSVKEFAKATGYTRAWIAYLIKTKRIKAQQFGRDYLIPNKEARKFIGKKRSGLNSVFPRLVRKKKVKARVG